jgi:hypothetical protein
MPECTCWAPSDAEPEDHDHDCPEHSCNDECDQAEEGSTDA